MDLVTVTATKDKDMFLLQAHSLNNFVEYPITHWIIIEDDATSEEDWINNIKLIYNRHKFNLIYNPTLKMNISLPGWRKQQVFKFTISEFIDSNYYIVLDSKNICIKQTDFFKMTEGNCTILPKENYKESPFYDWIKFLEKYLNKDLPDSFWSPETPFKMNTSVSKNIVKTFDLKKIFDQISVSEFIFYRFFTNAVPIPDFYHNAINITFWYSLPDINELKTLLTNQPECTMIGLHNNVIHTDVKKINDIADYLVGCGLNEKYINFLRK